MISYEKLKEICDKYGIDFEKLIKTNNNVLKYGEYREICDTLDYLRDEVKILSKNIEKCPSILYFSTKKIRDNWEFLKGKEIAISNVETCLHVLNTDGSQMRETYQHVIDNYGIRYLNAITSILSIPTSRIKEIERRFQDKFKPKNFLQAACSRFSIEEIEKIIQVCEVHNIEVTGSVFRQSAEEIEKIIQVCEKHNIELTGSVFFKSAEEIEKIVQVCKAHNIELTGSVFFKSAEEIEKIVKVCEAHKIKPTGNVFSKASEEIEKIIQVCEVHNIELTGNVFRQSAEEIEKIVKVCEKHNIELTRSVFLKTSEEIEKIIKVCETHNIEVTGSVFLKTSEEIEKIVQVCEAHNIELTGSVFLKSSEEIEKIIQVCEAHNIEVTGSVFLKTAEEIEKIVQLCKEYNIEVTGSVFFKSAEQIKKNIEYIKENYGEEFLKPLIISKSKKVLEETLPYLQKKGVLAVIKNSASILTLKLSEIQDREAFIEKIGESILRPDGKAFNSIFGLSRKKYAERKKQYTLSANDIGKASYVSKVEECDKADEVIRALVRENEQIKGNNIENN